MTTASIGTDKQKYIAVYYGNSLYVMENFDRGCNDYSNDYIVLGFPKVSSPDEAWKNFKIELQDFYPAWDGHYEEIFEEVILYPLCGQAYGFKGVEGFSRLG